MMKRLTLLLFLIFLGSSQGPNFPGTAANDNSSGVYAWVTPNNAKIEDGAVTTVTFSTVGDVSNWLAVSNFGFSVPNGATINGFVLEWKAEGTAGDLNPPANISQALMKDGAFGTSQDGTPGAGPEQSTLTGSLVYYSIGDPADSWFRVDWTPAEINASTFSAGLQMIDESDTDPTNSTASVDAVRLTVYYTTAAGATQRQISLGGDKGGITAGPVTQTLGKDGWH